MSLKSVQRAIEKKANAAVRGALVAFDNIFVDLVTEHQTTPVGTGRRRGESVGGETVERSAPGEFPWKEFNIASQGTGIIIKHNDMVGRWGTDEDGEVLIHLAYGHHPVSGEAYQRLGPVDAWNDNIHTIQVAAAEAAQAEPGT